MIREVDMENKMEKALATALENLVNRYISLANLVNASTNATRWQPDTDIEILDARKVLEVYKRRNPDA